MVTPIQAPLTEEQRREIWARVLAEVESHDTEIGRYWKEGWMPVVVLRPHADLLPALKSLGWKGNRACFGVQRDALTPLLRYPVERRWLERPAVRGLLQAFLFVDLGTFLLAKVPGQTPWCNEPGTLDEQLLD